MEHAVGQGDRSARWPAFSARPGPPLQRPLQRQLTLRWPGSPSSSLSGYNRSLTALLSGASPYLRVAKYSISPSSLQQADATGSGSCPVVSRSLVGPANTIAAKSIAALSSRRQSSRDFCDINHCVGQRARNLAAAGAVPILEHCKVKLFRQSHHVVISVLQKIGEKLKPTSLLRSCLPYSEELPLCRVRCSQFGSLGQLIGH